MRLCYLESLKKRRDAIEKVLNERLSYYMAILPAIYGENWDVEVDDTFRIKKEKLCNCVTILKKEGDEYREIYIKNMNISTLIGFTIALEKFDKDIEKLAKKMYENILDALSPEMYMEVLEREEKSKGE